MPSGGWRGGLMRVLQMNVYLKLLQLDGWMDDIFYTDPLLS